MNNILKRDAKNTLRVISAIIFSIVLISICGGKIQTAA